MLAIHQAESTPENPAMLATDTSKTPAAIGITTLSVISPVTALLLRIDRNVARVGNVSGSKTENTTMMRAHT